MILIAATSVDFPDVERDTSDNWVVEFREYESWALLEIITDCLLNYEVTAVSHNTNGGNLVLI